MLPLFPQFKKLELSDRSDIEKITSQYSPYSDFNFTSMWSWDINEETRISQLNDNLVVRFSDYLTGEPFYSFLGNNNADETVETLLSFSEKEGLGGKLKIVPDISVVGLDSTKVVTEEDRNNFDYIFDIDRLSKYQGKEYGDKRTMIHSFLRKYSHPKIKILDLHTKEWQNRIILLNEFWLENKRKKDEHFEIRNEDVAIKRFLMSGFNDILAIGVFLDEKLIGYSFFEFLLKNYSICHFSKADINIDGVYEYLMQECAIILSTRKCFRLNYEQDMGLNGLRYSKNSFGPVAFFKKYTVYLKTEE